VRWSLDSPTVPRRGIPATTTPAPKGLLPHTGQRPITPTGWSPTAGWPLGGVRAAQTEWTYEQTRADLGPNLVTLQIGMYELTRAG